MSMIGASHSNYQMESKFEIKKKHTGRSERVKSVDLHPSDNLLLCSLYSGKLAIWNYETQNLVKSFDCSSMPVRCAKFIPRKNWIIAGADDMHLRVFALHTHGCIADWEAHSDYIRGIAVHPTKPYVLSCSDDLSIKLWDWESSWTCLKKFENHTHYVMSVIFNPKDSNIFASCSLDRTIKIWNLSMSTPNYTLEGHEKGICSIEFSPLADKPFLISGGDDHLVKVWDYQNKICISTLKGHTNNITGVLFHGTLPLLITCSEDENIMLWSSNSFKLIQTIKLKLERLWGLSIIPGTSFLASGADLGSSVLQIGRDNPLITMDITGKVVWAKSNSIKIANVTTVSFEAIGDGQKLDLNGKDFGQCDIYPTLIEYSPSGRFISVIGDGEYVIYTAIACRNKMFGSCVGFGWSADSSYYAVLTPSSVNIFKQFENYSSISIPYSIIFGGVLLGAFSSRDSVLDFYSWDSSRLIRRLNVDISNVFWSENGEFLAIKTAQEGFFILKYNAEIVSAYIEQCLDVPVDGISEAFEVIYESSEQISSGLWIGSSFLFVTSITNKLRICSGGVVCSVFHLPSSFVILKYLSKLERIFFTDKECNVYAYFFSLKSLEILRLISCNLIDDARRLYDQVPKGSRELISSFLQATGHLGDALEFTDDQLKKFNLSLAIDNPKLALQLAEESSSLPSSKVIWHALGEYSLKTWNPELALKAFDKTENIPDTFIMKKCLGLPISIKENQLTNNFHLFLILFFNNSPIDAFKALLSSKRYPEAAFFARTYLSSSDVIKAVSLWKSQIKEKYESWNDFSELISDPSSAPEKFSFSSINQNSEDDSSNKEDAFNLVDTLKDLDLNGHPSPSSIKFEQKLSDEGKYLNQDIDLIGDTENDITSELFSEPSCIIQKEASSIVSTSSEENADILNSFSVSEESHFVNSFSPSHRLPFDDNSEVFSPAIKSSSSDSISSNTPDLNTLNLSPTEYDLDKSIGYINPVHDNNHVIENTETIIDRNIESEKIPKEQHLSTEDFTIDVKDSYDQTNSSFGSSKKAIDNIFELPIDRKIDKGLDFSSSDSLSPLRHSPSKQIISNDYTRQYNDSLDFDFDPIDKQHSVLEEDWDLNDESLSFNYDPELLKSKKKTVSWSNELPGAFSFSSDSLVDKYISDFSSNYDSVSPTVNDSTIEDTFTAHTDNKFDDPVEELDDFDADDWGAMSNYQQCPSIDSGLYQSRTSIDSSNTLKPSKVSLQHSDEEAETTFYDVDFNSKDD